MTPEASALVTASREVQNTFVGSDWNSLGTVSLTGGAAVAVGVSGTAITVSIESGGATLDEIAAALNDATNNPEAAALIDATVAEGQGGTSLTDAVAAFNLAGGADTVPAVDARPGAANPDQNTGTAQDGGALTWTQLVSETHEYVINLNNIDDNGPRFTSPENTVVAIDENTPAADTGVLFTAAAVDDDGDAVTYALATDFGGLFTIDAATGAVGLAAGETANFEARSSYELTIEARSTFPGGTAKLATQSLVVTINDTNDAPTGISLSKATFVPSTSADAVRVGALAALDEDTGDVHDFGLAGDDAGYFEIRDNGTADASLWFTGALEPRGPAATYALTLTATDPSGAATSHDLTVTEDGLFITTAEGANFSGAALIAENTDARSIHVDSVKASVTVHGLEFTAKADGAAGNGLSVFFSYTTVTSSIYLTTTTDTDPEGVLRLVIQLAPGTDKDTLGELLALLTSGSDDLDVTALTQVVDVSLADGASAAQSVNLADTDTFERNAFTLAGGADGFVIGNPLVLGKLGFISAPTNADASAIVYTFIDAEGGEDNALFEVDDASNLVFNGADSGDFEAGDTLSVRLQAEYYQHAFAGDFVGYAYADATGDATDADGRYFHYRFTGDREIPRRGDASGDALGFTASAAPTVDLIGTVNVAAGQLYLDDGRVVSFAADVLDVFSGAEIVVTVPVVGTSGTVGTHNSALALADNQYVIGSVIGTHLADATGDDTDADTRSFGFDYADGSFSGITYDATAGTVAVKAGGITIAGAAEPRVTFDAADALAVTDGDFIVVTVADGAGTLAAAASVGANQYALGWIASGALVEADAPDWFVVGNETGAENFKLAQTAKSLGEPLDPVYYGRVVNEFKLTIALSNVNDENPVFDIGDATLVDAQLRTLGDGYLSDPTDPTSVVPYDVIVQSHTSPDFDANTGTGSFIVSDGTLTILGDVQAGTDDREIAFKGGVFAAADLNPWDVLYLAPDDNGDWRVVHAEADVSVVDSNNIVIGRYPETTATQHWLLQVNADGLDAAYTGQLSTLPDDPLTPEDETGLPAYVTVPAPGTTQAEDLATGFDGALLFTASANDADGDAVVYSLPDGFGDNADFVIDAATGEVRFAAGAADYETRAAYHVYVLAQADSALPDGGAVDIATQLYVVTLTDVNEAPTAISVSRAALVAGDAVAGDLSATDEDTLFVEGRTGDTHTFDLVAGDGDTDNDLFEIDPDNGVTLRFKGTDGDFTTSGLNPGEDGRKQIGESYSVRIRVTDGGGNPLEQVLTIAEGSTFIFDDIGDDNTPNDGELRKYSNFVDVAGDGLLDENADGSTTPILVGHVSVEGLEPAQRVALGTADLSGAGLPTDDATTQYAVTAVPAAGTLQLSGTALAANDTFTLQDVLDGSVVFVNDATNPATAFSAGFSVQSAAVTGIDADAGASNGAASLTTSDFIFTAKDGAGGASISVALVASSSTATLDPSVSVAVTGKAITITYGVLGSNSVSHNDVLRAVTDSAAASALVDVALAAGVTSTTLASGDAFSATNLVSDEDTRTFDLVGGDMTAVAGGLSVADGTIYAGADKQIAFTAATLGSTEAGDHIVVVDNGDATGTVQAAGDLSTLTAGGFYVLGKVDSFIGPQAASTEEWNDLDLVFTSKSATQEYAVSIVIGTTAGSGVDTAKGSGGITVSGTDISITLKAGGATNKQVIDAVAASAGTANDAAALVTVSKGGGRNTNMSAAAHPQRFCG